MTRAQMRRLERFLWQGKPLLHEVRRDSGLHAGRPRPRILGMEHAPQAEPQARTAASSCVCSGGTRGRDRPQPRHVRPPARGSGTRDRACQRLGVAAPHSGRTAGRTAAQGAERGRLLAPGTNGQSLSSDIAKLASYEHPFHFNFYPCCKSPCRPAPRPGGLGRTRRPDRAPPGRPRSRKDRSQLDWLPLRNAHDPARFLVAAIQKDYAPPASVRNRQALEQAMRDSVPPARPRRTFRLTLPPTS